MATRQPDYFLTPHCYLARIDQLVILLDSRSDDYILIEPPLAEGLLTQLRGTAGGDPAPDFAELLGNLERHGAITSEARLGKPLDMLEMIPSSREIQGPRIEAIPRLRLVHVMHMFAAVCTAVYFLKVRRFSATLAHVRRLRQRPVQPGLRTADPSDLVEIYLRVRPFFYSAKDRCLLNSLVLILFLARYGRLPYWCFGVKVSPFSAHCWVEDAEWLYNDQYCRTYQFTPIMRV